MKFSRTDTISHTIGAAGRFAIGLVDGEVRVRGVDGDDVRATVRYDIDAGSNEEADRIHDAVRISERRGDGLLELDEPRRDGSWPEALARLIAGGWRHGRSDIAVDVEIPRRASVRVRGVTADLRVDDTAGDLELRSVSGDVFVMAAEGTLALETVSGSAQVSAAGRLGLRCRTVSGDLVAAAGEIAESRVVTVSGDVELEGALGVGEHRVETASGDLRVATPGAITIDVTGIAADIHSEIAHRIEGSMGHRRLFVGEGGPELRFRTMSGSLVVTGANRGAMPMPPPPAEPPIVLPAPAAARPPGPPEPPEPVRPPTADDERMAVLRAVERGELDVDDALRRLAEVTNA